MTISTRKEGEEINVVFILSIHESTANQGPCAREEWRLDIREQLEVSVPGMDFLFVRLLRKIAGGL